MNIYKNDIKIKSYTISKKIWLKANTLIQKRITSFKTSFFDFSKFYNQ